MRTNLQYLKPRLALARDHLWTWLEGKRVGRRLSSFQKNRPLQISYGLHRMPTVDEYAQGGLVKFVHLAKYFPHHPQDFNLLYLVSSQYPRYAKPLVRRAQNLQIPFFWNQNGVNYPGSSPIWKDANRQMAEFFQSADHVFFQSEFCQRTAYEFLGSRKGSSQILYNAVDLSLYRPLPSAARPLTFLAAGSVGRWYRLEVALKTLQRIQEKIPDARLIVAGRFCWKPDRDECRREALELVSKLKLQPSVEFIPEFSQAQAPEVYSRADILLHTKVNDPCPGVVIEAMACGLPVIYSKTGGVPELVGEEAGRGAEGIQTMDEMIPPQPEALAEVAFQIYKDLENFKNQARRRAEQKFSFENWVAAHREVFKKWGYPC